MRNTCIRMEFMDDQNLYVLTNHQEEDYYESRIFSYNIATEDVQPLYIFESWIKQFRIIEKEKVWASQWDDSIYRLSPETEEQFTVAIPCITDFARLEDGRLFIVGFDGRTVYLSPDGKKTTVMSGIDRDIISCLEGKGVIHGCGAQGLYFELAPDASVEVFELPTNCTLTAMSRAPNGDLLIGGNGVLLRKQGDAVDVLAEGDNFYESIWRGDSFYVCASRQGVMRVGPRGIEPVSDVPCCCIAQTTATIASGGLDNFTIYGDDQRRTVRLDRDFLERIHVFV
jgi:hypothetical protein